jgi:hypothetical protein
VGEGLPRREAPNPHLKSRFPRRKNSNHHGEDLGTESSWEREKSSVGLFWREKVRGMGVFIDGHYQFDRYKKLV